jgi:hypothetical protein
MYSLHRANQFAESSRKHHCYEHTKAAAKKARRGWSLRAKKIGAGYCGPPRCLTSQT